LGDFTFDDDRGALLIFFQALAEKSNLREYITSINFAIAKQYLALDEIEKSWAFAMTAAKAVQSPSDLALRREISEVMLEIGKYNTSSPTISSSTLV